MSRLSSGRPLRAGPVGSAGLLALPMPTRNADGRIQTTRGHGALRLSHPTLVAPIRLRICLTY
jgi:hypothetical protein